MTNELAVPADILGGEPVKELGILGATSYLGRIQLCGAKSKAAGSGDIPVNHYAYINGDRVVDLTKNPDVLILAWRPLALDMNDGKVVSAYDQESDAFKDIARRAATANSMCTFGPQYLVYIPAIEEFASFHLGSTSARKQAESAHSRIGKWANLGHKMGKNDKWTWAIPTIGDCQTPHTLPTKEQMQEQLESFRNPPVEKTPETAGTDAPTRDR